jgi:hypothetical protein
MPTDFSYDPSGNLQSAASALLRIIERMAGSDILAQVCADCNEIDTEVLIAQGTPRAKALRGKRATLNAATFLCLSLQRSLDRFLSNARDELARAEAVPAAYDDPGPQCYAPHCARHTPVVVRNKQEWWAHLQALEIPVQRVATGPARYPCIVQSLTEYFIGHGRVLAEFIYPSALLAELIDAEDSATREAWRATWGLPRRVDTEAELLAVFGQHYPIARPERLEGRPTHYPCRVLEFIAPEFPMPASFRGVYQYDV